MGVLLLIILVVVLAVVLGAGSYSVRRYWSPAGSEVVETGDAAGPGVGTAAAVVALLVLFLLFFGVTQLNRFGGTESSAPGVNNPAVSSPAPAGGGGVASPSAMPSGSP